MASSVDSAADRRRQRRLRQFLRHERLSVAMALAETLHHSSRGQRFARAGGGGARGARRVTTTEPLLPRRSSGCIAEWGARPGRSQTLGRRNGSSGTPWSTLSTSSAARLWCRFSTLLCRSWWNSCQTCSSSLTSLRLFPSRLSKCPRFFLRTYLCARFCVTRSWQNKTLTFLVVEGEFPVFKVFFPDRVQQRRVPLRNAFLSGLWSRSLIFPVEAFKIFAQDRVHPLLRTFQLVLMTLWMRLVMFFRTFPLFF